MSYFSRKTKTSTARERFSVVKSADGVLYSSIGQNKSTSGSTLYLQLYNTAGSTPTGTPVMTQAVPAGSLGYFDYGELGRPFDTGIIVALSAAEDSYSDPGANGWFDTVYV